MYKEFKDILVELRSENKLTQSELATRLGVVKSTIANYEKGYRKPDNDTLIKLASIFGVSTDYLLGFEDIAKTLSYGGSDEKIIKADNFTYAMFEEAKDLTDEQKEALLAMARAFKNK